MDTPITPPRFLGLYHKWREGLGAEVIDPRTPPPPPKLSVLGGGKMATALVEGFVRAECFAKEDVFVCTRSEETAKGWESRGYTAHTHDAFYQRVEPTEIIVLTVKPQMFSQLIEEVHQHPAWTKRAPSLIISVMAGIHLDRIRKAMAPSHDEVIRLMPNVACALGCGALCLCADDAVRKESVELVMELATTVGVCFEVEESKFDAAGALTGCSPGWVFEVFEGLVKGGVASGIDRALATQMVAQAIKGSAQLLIDSGKAPLTLQSEVCSPKGTTLAGLGALREAGVEAAFTEALIRSVKRAEELSK